MKYLLCTFFSLVSFLSQGAGPNDDPKRDTVNADFNWFNEDFTATQIFGLGTDKAYLELLADRKSTPIIVAVIDSGIDIDHEDLEGKIWVNEDEIAGNGIDDDQNGYIDDINGWNFIGGPDGNVINENLELTRLYRELGDRFRGKNASEVAAVDKEDYLLYKKVKEEYETEVVQAQQMAEQWVMFELSLRFSENVVKGQLQKEEYTIEEVAELEEKNDSVAMAKGFLLQIHEAGFSHDQIEGMRNQITSSTEYHLNLDYNPRTVVGDDPEDPNQRFYGNNDVEGEYADHGTHVAGIIGANRANELGIKGIVDNVQIMSIRAIPNGDERDKDVANAIRYAVENGAKVINMSFGKEFSPSKEAVDEAFQFAEQNGVLIVHGSGNDGNDIDVTPSYPTPNFKNGEQATNWITVGASDRTLDENLPATFSNYGKEGVDLFAPGVSIYSLKPGDQYVAQDGTSMACPMVSGVAALVWSYFPDLTVEEVRAALIKSVSKQKKAKVLRPQTQSLDSEEEPTLVKFGELSVTGGVLNAYEAVRLASRKSKK